MKQIACIGGVAALGVLIRLIVLAQVSGDAAINHFSGDAQAYIQWARNISSGHWIGSEVFYQAPLYPYFLAILGRLGIHDNAVRLVQALLGGASCFMLGMAGRRWFGQASGIIAAAMLAVYPAAVSFDLQIDKPVLDLLLMTALLWCMAGFMESAARWRWFGCGVLIGLLALSRENALVLIGVLAVFAILILRTERSLRHRWVDVAFLLGGAVCILMPVSIRNTVIDRAFHLTTAQFGPNFYIGNSAGADGVYHPLRPGRGDAEFERADATNLAEQSVGHPLNAGGVSAYWTRRAVDDIAAKPLRWIALLGRKIVLTLSSTELADSDVHDRFVVLSSVLRALDTVWGFGVLLALAGMGTALARNQRRNLLLLWAMVASLVLATAMFYVFARYRLLITPLLMLIASAGLKEWRTIGAKQRGRWLIGVLCTAAAIGVAAAGDALIPMRIRGTNSYNRAVIFAERGDGDSAQAYYRRAIQQNPDLAAAYCNLGLLLADWGELSQAEPMLRQAVRIEPTDPTSHINLGMILARQDQLPAAIDEFNCALRYEPSNTAARYNLGAALMVQGRRDEAIRLLQSLIDSAPNDPFAQRAAGLLKNMKSGS